MINYPYNRHVAAVPPGTHGYPAAGIPQVGGQVPLGGTIPPQIPSGSMIPGVPGTAVEPTLPGQLPLEQSYVENILRLNLGKVGTFYMTYENNREWNAKIFRGRVEAAGRDHVIISDPSTGTRFLLLMVNLDYVTFEGELNYFPTGHPGAGIAPGGR